MTMEQYNEAMRILDLLDEKVNFAIAQLEWIKFKEEVLKWEHVR